MKISIIILTYNQEKYISETLESILNQDTNDELEIIVGDDCSQDETRNILNNYQKNFPSTIKLNFQINNQGVVRNFFSTVAMSTGDYICPCGGDDFWNKNKLKEQVNYLSSHPEDIMCYTAVNKIDSSGNCIGSIERCNRNLFLNNNICASSVCFKRELLLNYIKDIEPLKKAWIMEDYPMWLYAYTRYKIGYINKYLTNYRVLSTSITHSGNVMKRINFEKCCHSIRLFFLSNENKYLTKQVNNQYYKNIGHLYRIHGMKKEFRDVCLKQKTIEGFVKYCLSFIK